MTLKVRSVWKGCPYYSGTDRLLDLPSGCDSGIPDNTGCRSRPTVPASTGTTGDETMVRGAAMGYPIGAWAATTGVCRPQLSDRGGNDSSPDGCGGLHNSDTREMAEWSLSSIYSDASGTVGATVTCVSQTINYVCVCNKLCMCM